MYTQNIFKNHFLFKLSGFQYTVRKVETGSYVWAVQIWFAYIFSRVLPKISVVLNMS